MKNKIKRFVFIALYVALALAIDYIKEMLPFLNMPQGGSINIATIPVVIASFHLGVIDGAITGFLWMLISFPLGLNYPPIGVLEFIGDYFIPSVILGFASILGKRGFVRQELGIVLVNVIRSLSILFSGAYFWFPKESSAGSAAAWLNSIQYNLPYLLATSVMLMIVTPILLDRLQPLFTKKN